MYERNAIVLERYFCKKLGYQKTNNLKENFSNYCNLLEKIEQFQIKSEAENKSLTEFNDVSNRLASIQQMQEKLYKRNAKLEYSRNLIFGNIEEDVNELSKCLNKIESDISKTQTAFIETRENFISTVELYQTKKKELDVAIQNKNEAEEEYNSVLENAKANFENIELDIVDYIKGITTDEIRKIKRELIEVITKNGAKEKIPFDADIVSKASEFATEISKKEAECYVIIYDKTKKLLDEIENNSLKMDRHRKWRRDNTAKLKFFNAEKEYLIQFLDNERLPVMHGKKIHRKLMLEACKNLILDVDQMNNLYELILREEAGRSAKKAYKELYNKDYFRKIEEGSLQIEDEASKLGLNIAMVINSNYWRVEGIREIYTAFYQIITEIYGKELEEFETAEEETAKEQTSNIEETVELELPQAKTIESIAEEDDEIEEEEEKQNIQNAQIVEETAKEKVKINNIEISNTNEDTEEFEEDEEDEFADIESQIAELEDDFENEEYDSIKDIPYEDEKIDDFDAEESLFAPIIKAKETGEDLKAALQAVKEGPSKKKKSNIFKNLIKMNTKGKKVEG